MSQDRRESELPGGPSSQGLEPLHRGALERSLAAALAHLDAGRLLEARGEIEGALASMGVDPGPAVWPDERAIEPFESIEDGELERAFEAAEAEPAAMVDVNDVAANVLRASVFEEPDGAEGSRGETFPFPTRTAAELLEQQGHTREAQAVRARLASGDSAALPRAAVIATLEGWLDNLRREVR